jgi:hypothetical protein
MPFTILNSSYLIDLSEEIGELLNTCPIQDTLFVHVLAQVNRGARVGMKSQNETHFFRPDSKAETNFRKEEM